jgi:carbamoyl-phosphate synthase large subunit
MAIGRTFQEALCKAIRALEPSTAWRPPAEVSTALLREKLHVPGPDRLHWLFEALERGMGRDEVCELTKIDPWFIAHLEGMLAVDKTIAATTLRHCTAELLLESKRSGASDEEIAKLWNVKSSSVRSRRHELGVTPVFKRVDTCAAEFESFTPYLYSTYEQEDESDAVDRPKIVILGSGPNRIGQGIEFDYCCCHASFALKEDGYETVMVNLSRSKTFSPFWNARSRRA